MRQKKWGSQPTGIQADLVPPIHLEPPAGSKCIPRAAGTWKKRGKFSRRFLNHNVQRVFGRFWWIIWYSPKIHQLVWQMSRSALWNKMSNCGVFVASQKKRCRSIFTSDGVCYDRSCYYLSSSSSISVLALCLFLWFENCYYETYWHLLIYIYVYIIPMVITTIIKLLLSKTLIPVGINLESQGQVQLWKFQGYDLGKL